MKYLILICFVFYSFNAFTQDFDFNNRQDVSFHTIKVRELIDSLSQQFQVEFTYDANALPLDSIISITRSQSTIKEIIYSVLSKNEIDVSYFMGQIVLSKNQLEEVKNEDGLLHLKGTVFDLQTSEPVQMVNISIVNKPLGTITNELGNFDFIIPNEYAGLTIAFSSIGYKRINIIVPNADSCVNIPLDSERIQLPEVQVKVIPALLILNKVIENRDRNYFDSYVSLNCFYRETVKQDAQYVQVSEAILEIYKPSYQQNSSLERVRFIKGRKRDDVAKLKNINFRLQGGPYIFSRLDIARYLDFMPTNNEINNYCYSYQGVRYLGDNRVYVIDFKPIKDDGDLLYKGEFFINANDYAIVAVEFEMTPNTLKRSRDYLIRKDQRNNRARPYYARYYIDYRPYKDMWMLNMIRGEIKLKIVDKKQKLKSEFIAKSEMLITDFRPIDGERIKYSETFKPDYVLYDKLKVDDSDFWEKYNIIQPDDDLDKIFSGK